MDFRTSTILLALLFCLATLHVATAAVIDDDVDLEFESVDMKKKKKKRPCTPKRAAKGKCKIKQPKPCTPRRAKKGKCVLPETMEPTEPPMMDKCEISKVQIGLVDKKTIDAKVICTCPDKKYPSELKVAKKLYECMCDCLETSERLQKACDIGPAYWTQFRSVANSCCLNDCGGKFIWPTSTCMLKPRMKKVPEM